MKDGNIEGGESPKIEEEKEMPHWGPDDLSPWGRFGEEYNGDAEIAIEKGWVKYDLEHNQYILTSIGEEEEKKKRKEPPLTPSFYQYTNNTDNKNTKKKTGKGNGHKKKQK